MFVGFLSLLLFRRTDWTCPTSAEVFVVKNLRHRNWGGDEQQRSYCICCQRDKILCSPAREARNREVKGSTALGSCVHCETDLWEGNC